MVGTSMTRRTWWLRYLVGCAVLIGVCAWWYVQAVLSLPGLVGYEREWRFQLLMLLSFGYLSLHSRLPLSASFGIGFAALRRRAA
jgi:hypothetical protein